LLEKEIARNLSNVNKRKEKSLREEKIMNNEN
jgi:hypothetical protein